MTPRPRRACSQTWRTSVGRRRWLRPWRWPKVFPCVTSTCALYKSAWWHLTVLPPYVLTRKLVPLSFTREQLQALVAADHGRQALARLLGSGGGRVLCRAHSRSRRDVRWSRCFASAARGVRAGRRTAQNAPGSDALHVGINGPRALTCLESLAAAFAADDTARQAVCCQAPGPAARSGRGHRRGAPAGHVGHGL